MFSFRDPTLRAACTKVLETTGSLAQGPFVEGVPVFRTVRENVLNLSAEPTPVCRIPPRIEQPDAGILRQSSAGSPLGDHAEVRPGSVLLKQDF